MLTNAAVKAAGARSRAYKIFDERGLHLFVATNGRKSWRMKFQRQGKEQLLTFGTWPEISLADARAQCEAAREQLGRGVDPRTAETALAEEVRAFEYEARRWHEHMRGRWTDVHAADVLVSLERDVFPAIGAMPLPAITPPVVLNIVRSIEDRGSLETAKRVRQRISAVFAFAISEGLIDKDPAGIIGRVLQPAAPVKPQPALLELEQLHALLAAISAVPGAHLVKLAHLFLALTAVRLEALRGARWCEIEDLDGDAPIWRVPAARMKLAKAKKGTPANDHVVPLSPAAVTVLRAARDLLAQPVGNADRLGGGGLIFPGRGGSSPLGEAAIGAAIARAGFKGRHVPHGWRASFSTVMNERYPAERDAIDQALAHAPKNKVEAAYNRAQQLERRRWIYERWAQLLIR